MNVLVEILVFLLPFERIPSIEWQGLTLRLSSFVLLAMAIGGLPVLFWRGRLKPLSLLDIVVLAFVGVGALSMAVAFNPMRSSVVIAILLLMVSAYFVVSRLAQNRQNLDRYLDIAVMAGLFSSLFGLFQFFGDAAGLGANITGLLPRYQGEVFGFARVQSFGMEPLYFANFLLLPIFILLGRALYAKADWSQIAQLGLIFLAFVLTLSRGAFIAFAVGLLMMLLIAARRSAGRRNILIGLGTLIISTASALILIFAVSGATGIQTFGGQATIVAAPVQSSTTSRLEHYQQAWQIFTASPLLGVGIGNYDEASRLPDTPLDQGRQIVNNQYLETLAETGLLGLASLAAALLLAATWLVRGLKRDSSYLPVTFLALLLAIAVQYNFFSTIYLLHLWVALGLIAGYLRGLGREDG